MLSFCTVLRWSNNLYILQSISPKLFIVLFKQLVRKLRVLGVSVMYTLLVNMLLRPVVC